MQRLSDIEHITPHHSLPHRLLFMFLSLFLACAGARAQDLHFGKVQKVNGIEFFPVVENPNIYYFLPARLQLAKNKDGVPNFFFEKLFEHQLAEDHNSAYKALGILQFEVELGLDTAAVETAWSLLKEQMPNAVLAGPMTFDSCHLSIVSSVANPNSGFVIQYLDSGHKLLKAGDRARYTIVLNDLGARILWSTFETETPDLTLTLEASKNGYENDTLANMELKPVVKTFRTDNNITRPERCRSCFMERMAGLWANEPGYQSRVVYLLGNLPTQAEEAAKGVQFVLRKKHADGYTTMQDLMFESPIQMQDRLKHHVFYPKNPGDQGENWLQYEYQFNWFMSDGSRKSSGWLKGTEILVLLDWTP